jgi:hypothetical protein
VLSDLQEGPLGDSNRAFSEHQQLSEDRRHLAAEIGELIAAFIAELVAAGWSEKQARGAVCISSRSRRRDDRP